MAFIEVDDAKTLQVGVFVKLEGSWFSHPFPTNTFTIKSAEDLATIQGLTNVTILYDPDRSESSDSDDISNNSDGHEENPGDFSDVSDGGSEGTSGQSFGR